VIANRGGRRVFPAAPFWVEKYILKKRRGMDFRLRGNDMRERKQAGVRKRNGADKRGDWGDV